MRRLSRTIPTAIKLDPENVPAYNNRARAYISMEKYEEAIKDYTDSN